MHFLCKIICIKCLKFLSPFVAIAPIFSWDKISRKDSLWLTIKWPLSLKVIKGMWVKQGLAVILTPKIRQKKFGLKFNVPLSEHHYFIQNYDCPPSSSSKEERESKNIETSDNDKGSTFHNFQTVTQTYGHVGHNFWNSDKCHGTPGTVVYYVKLCYF